MENSLNIPDMRPVALQSPFGLRIPTYHFAGELYKPKRKISINL